jgi:hypothetical protein
VAQSGQSPAKAPEPNEGVVFNLFKRKASHIDRRVDTREPVHVPAVVMLQGEFLPCTTTDVSEGGAKLKLKSARTLVGQLRLQISGHDRIRQARVVRQDGEQVAVQFQD